MSYASEYRREREVEIGNAMANGIGVESAPRISRLTSNVQKAIGTNEEIVDRLSERLHAVLLPSTPTVNGPNAAEVREAVSPLSSDLESFEARLYAMSARLTDMLNRLEI